MNVQYLFETYGFWPFVIALATMVLTSLAKIPVKLLIGKIKNETARNLVERLILLIPVGIGIGLCYLKAYILKSGEDSVAIVMAGAACGALAVIYYNLFGKYIELAVLKLFNKDAKLKDDKSMGKDALNVAIDIANGKPIESVVKELINNDGAVGVEKAETVEIVQAEDSDDEQDEDEEFYDEDDDGENDDYYDLDEVLEAVCEYTGADPELVTTILNQLKNN